MLESTIVASEEGFSTLRFLATLTFEKAVVENVRCKLILPRKVRDKPVAYFTPTPEQREVISHLQFWRFSLEGQVRRYDGEVSAHVKADPVYAHQLNYDGLPDDLSETTFQAEPALLDVTTLISHGPQVIEGKFWLTPNPLLQPASMSSHSFTGNVEVKTVHECEFSPYPELTLKFNKHYKHYNNADGDDISFSELVATFELPGTDLNDTEATTKALDAMNDVALLSSVAARRTTVCLGWEANDSKTWVRHYLRNRTLPSDDDDYRHEELIEPSNIIPFLKIAYPASVSYGDTRAFRRLLHFVLPKNKSTVDSNFVTLYTALEMLVLHFRKNVDLENILPKKDFRKIRREMEELIDNSTDINEVGSKEEMKRKLSELNRVSFGSAFETFCQNFQVDLSDLWPVADSSEGISLMKIRNLLVHGEHFGPEQYKGMVVAREHLRWTVERMVLGVLHWPVDNSRVSSGYLALMNAYSEWKVARSFF